ncbi:SusC/RagA family TonB-linked outer membrane protein [Cyclobacterium amurskyense]|uniref:TonB-dependent receptor plug n=1 Tax=Cyclobacterium amurskyense TaxID=320787 RepID=A0A0H4PH40_9BACT|nr:TonB-dependent receptor [Cyclobacterium amurskyense]AKP53479.1 TonB-dependent receptor plug [Cyclobacterium amurskyense]
MKIDYKSHLHRATNFSLIGILIPLMLVNFSIAHGAGAQKAISIEKVFIETFYSNTTLKEVFDDIESKTDFVFTFDFKDDFLKERFSSPLKKRSVEEILKKVSGQSKLAFRQTNNNISVTRSTKGSRVIEVISKVDDIGINGRVTSFSDKQGLPGVTILVKGTNIGTVTDIDGNFSLNVPNENATLVISFLGYETREESLNGRSIINVELSEDAKGLDEFVVIGYGIQKEREVTGSITSVEADQLEDQPVGQFVQKLQGRMAGVQISQASGTPGGGMAVRIRGAASINAGNNPLYVVDGFPIVGDINTINPNEIESFSVLKGASASALYGSRAANGVVLITTKRAKPGQTSVQLSVIQGVTQVPNRGRADLMNAREFLEDRKAIYEDKIRYEGYTGGIPELYQNPEAYTGPDTDWYDELLQGGKQNSYNVSFLANKDNFSSATTIGFFDEKGVVINTGFQRFSLRTNNEYKINKNIRVGLNLAPTHQLSRNQATDGFYSILYSAIITPPIFSPNDVDENGNQKVSFTGPGLFTFPNWKKTMTETLDRSATNRLLTNAYFEADIQKDFFFKSSVSVDMGTAKRRIFNPSTAGGIFSPPPKLATGSYTTYEYSSWLTENTLNYTKNIGNHFIDALVGYSAQKYHEEYNQLTGTSYPDDEVPWIDAAAIRYGSGNMSEWSLLSMFSRLNYNYMGKYLLSLSVRRDGSSRFGSENRWGTFPSVSAGWIISDEPFMADFTDLSYLKIRGEYGHAGNFNIGNYSQFGNISSTNYVFGGTLAQGRSPVSIGNPFLTWETTKGIDLGVDVGLFNDKVSLVFDFYDKRTNNMLYQVDIPYGTGYPNIQDNIGEFHFWGYEFGIHASVIETAQFQWNSDFNISFNRNKVIQLGTNNTPLGGIGNYSSTIWKTEVGQPIGQFYGYVFDGIYKTQEEFDSQPTHFTSSVGTIRYKDINEDGVINVDDKTYIGNPNPKFFYGFNNNFYYKNFDMNIVISGSYGGKMYYSLAEWSETLEGIFNVERYMKDRWRSLEDPGDGIIGRSLSGTTEFPRNVQDRLALDASHLTFKNITLGYSLPEFSEFVSSSRVFLSLQNAFVLTPYKGANPESSWQGLNGLQEGVDISPYPIPRTYALGVNFNF